MKLQTDFEFIHTIEYTTPYLALLGLGWAMVVEGIINLMDRSMIKENNGTQLIISLDSAHRMSINGREDWPYQPNAKNGDHTKPAIDGMIW